MSTPIKKSDLGKGYNAGSVSRSSSLNNSRGTSERVPSYNSETFHYISTSSPKASMLGPRSRNPSRAPSRQASRDIYPPPPRGSGLSTPQHKSFSRSTSRSSSRLSLSSISSTGTQIASATSSIDSPFSIHTVSESRVSRIKVSVRPKPLSFLNNVSTPWVINCQQGQIVNDEIGCFQYDHVFSPSDSNSDVFDVVAAPVVEKCLQGFNGTVFAYGMTGSGKTYSMKGVLHDSAKILFNNLDNSKVTLSPDRMDQDTHSWNNDDGGSPDSNIFHDDTILANGRYKVKYMTCSILEIYNEKVKDLLTTNDEVANKSDLKIIDDSKFGIKVYGLKEVKVQSRDHFFELIDQGENVRSTDSTDYNYTSSRSHFIVTLKLCLLDHDGLDVISVLNFCDLAGSERATSHIDRRKEGGYINKSLLALGTVITKLSESNGSSNAHVPYRDSKLTRLLQPSLSGDSMVSILCTIHLGANVIGETTNTLRFGSRAKNVLINVRKNIGEIDTNKLIQENESLKLEIEELRFVLDGNVNSTSTSCTLVNNGNNGMDIHGDEVYYELVAENNILNEQVEHLKRLNMEESLIRSNEMDEDLQNLNELLNGLILDTQTRRQGVAILERLNSKIQEERHRFDETESYVSHLENRIRSHEIEMARYRQDGEIGANKSASILASKVTRPAYNTQQELIDELKEEIDELKLSMQRKDAVIRALQRAGRS